MNSFKFTMNSNSWTSKQYIGKSSWPFYFKTKYLQTQNQIYRQ